MSRPARPRRARMAGRARSHRRFHPSVTPLEGRLLLTADAEGDSIATALAASLAVGSLYSHQATIGDGAYLSADVDLYAVPMTAGQHLLVAVEARALDEGGSLSNLDSYLRVFNASGTQLTYDDDASNPFTGVSSYDSSLSFVASSSGTYYLGVSSYGNSTYNPNTAGTGASGSTTGAYRLELLLSNSAPLAAPTGLSATSPGSSEIDLSWTAVAAATGYTVQRSANGSNGWATIGTAASGTTAYSDTGLAGSTAYYYRVQASDADSISPYSAQATTTTPLAAPTSLTATAVSATQINLTWTDNSTAASSYYVNQSTNGTTWTEIGYVYGSAADSYTASGSFNGSTTYYFQVYAYAYPGGDSADDTASVTTPAFPNPPTLTSATAQSATSVGLAWSSVTGATGYTIERSTNGGSTWTTAGTVGTGVTTFTDTGLTQTTTYTYEVIATNSAGSSAPSATLSVTTHPAAPTGLTLTAVSSSQINLTWTDNSSSATNYYVQQSPDGTTWTTVASFYSSTVSSATATGPFDGSTTYYFQVYAYVYPGGYSADDTASVTTPAFPNPPTLTSATAQSATSVALTWASVTGATGYTIERSTNSGSTWTTAGTAGTGGTTFTDTGLTEATTYTYEVIATNSAGSSAPSTTLSVATQPAPPTGLTLTAVSGTQINLTWTDNSSSVSYYFVKQSPNGMTWTAIASLNGSTADSYTATGPFNGSTIYYFQVYAYAGTGGDSADDTASVTTPAFPNPPTLTSATAQSATSGGLAWSSVTGATGYTIERSTNSGSTWTTAGTVGTGVTTFTDTGLTQTTTYTYEVIATNSAGSSAPSASLSVTTHPAAPTGLTATAVSGSQINLTWTDNSPSASYYFVKQSPNGTTWTTIASLNGSTADSYTATGPFNGSTIYYFQVYAYAGTGGYSADDTASVTTPAFPNPPTLTSATAQSATSVALAWSSVTGATGYTIERSTNSGSNWTTAGTVATGVTTFTDTGLTQTTTYTYEVIATNSAGSSDPSATLSVVTQPAQPTGLTATVVSGSQIDLTWTDNSPSASYYYVQQSPNGTSWTTIASIYGSTAGSYTATGPFTGSTTYYFQVYAYAYPGGDSTDDTASVTTPAFPNQPTLSSATAQSATSVALAWSSVTGATGYTIERSTNGGSTWTTAGTVGTGVTTFTDTGLTEATTYTYRVTAANAAGSSAPSATQTIATQPAPPTGLAATAVSAVQINLAWTDQSTAATAYYVEQSTDDTNWTVLGYVSGTTANGYTATGPFSGSTTYYYQVRAYSSVGGYSAFTPVTSMTTAAFPNQPILTATLQSNAAIVLTWTDVPRETGFLVQQMVGGTWTTIATLGTGVTTFTDTGLHEATSYSFQVIATNSVGNSAPSAAQTVATQPAPPTGLTVTFVSPVQINLTWTDQSAAATAYYVEQSTNDSTWTVLGDVFGTTADSDTAAGPFNGSTTYYFQVQAYSSVGGYSAFAPVASLTTAAFPNQPILTATPQSNAAIVLSWTDVPRETGFLVQQMVGGTLTTIETLGTGVTTYTEAGLHEATSYSFQVIATNSVGNSAPSAVQTVYTLLDAPLSVAATFVSDSQINLSWTDRSSMATGYDVEQSTDGVNWIQIGSVGATATSFTATGSFSPSTPYDFEIQAYDSAGETADSPVATVTRPAIPLIPTGVTAVPASDTSVTVTWNAMTNADGYEVERSTDGASTWTIIATLPASQTTLTDTGLTEGESLYYRVLATDAVFDYVSPGSDVSGATTLPTVPSGLQVTAIDGGQVELQWVDYSAVAAGYAIEQLIDGAYQQIQTTGPGATSATVAGTFAPSTSYSFEVQAFETLPDSANQSSLPSNVAQVTTGAWPVVPSNLVATAASETEIDLTWTDNAGVGADYEVERSADGGNTWTQIATVPAGSTGTAEYDDTGLTGGETASYEYQVRATIAGVGNSAYGAIAGATTLLATPTDLTATISDGGDAELTWVGNSALATDYIVNELVGGQWQELQETVGVVQSVTVYGNFAPSTTYEFQVVADMETETAAASSAPSNEATATTAAWPAAPTNLTATAVSGSEVDLTWTDNATNATSYEVERTTDGVNWTVLTSTLPSTATSYDDTGLSDGTMYGYQVFAVNSVGGSGYAGATVATLPTAPTNLQGTVVSSSEIDLSWTASTDATGYTISIEEEGSTTWTDLATVPASQTTYAATGLEPGTDYSFCVAPTNSTAPTAVAYLDPMTLDTPPTITGTYGADDPVTGTSVTLVPVAEGGAGMGVLTYQWTSGTMANPGSAVVFSANNSTAETTVVTFYMAGTYTINVQATDSAGVGSNWFSTSVTVNQTLSGIVVTSTNSTATLGQVTQTANGLQIAPGNAGVLVGQTQQFYDIPVDQFGNPMQEPPSVTWSAAGAAGGTIAAGGLYTAPTTLDQDSTDTVTASAGGFTGTANVAVLTANIKVNMVQDQQPESIDEIDLSQYKNITQIVVTNWDPAGLHYDDFSFDGANGAQFIDMSTLAVGTVVTSQFPGVTFNGGTVSPDLDFAAVYMPPGGWGGTMVVQFAGPVNNLMFSTGWVDTGMGGVYGQVAITTARLLSLTVNDDSNPNNSVTAIQNQPQQLYVPVNPDDDGGAEIDINALPSAGGDQTVHIRVMIGDPNGVVADEDETSLDDLLLPAQGNYVIEAWVDNDDDGDADPNEDELVVDVSVVQPWSVVGNWTSNVANYVVANAPGASLQSLAQDITGDPTDASFFLNMGPITKGELVDVTPLLTVLQQTVNNNIVAAALTVNDYIVAADENPEIPNRFSSGSILPGQPWSVQTIGEAQLNSFFSGGWTGPQIPYNCLQMAQILIARGVQMSLQPGEFDQIGQNVENFFKLYTLNLTGTPLAQLQPGNMASFANAPDPPAPIWSVENTIVLGGGEYFGWPLGVKTVPELKESLMNAYNKGVQGFNSQFTGWFSYWSKRSEVTIQQIPGYLTSGINAPKAVNIPALAQAVFNLRTSNQ